MVGRSHWGKGVGTAAARLVTRYGFDALDLAEIQAEVLQRNLASVRLLEKAGFRLLRVVPGDPQSEDDLEDRFLYVLGRRSDTAA
jgi:RimJ/RimL family protein N-acetyltransferase